jgi:hypothetical protein
MEREDEDEQMIWHALEIAVDGVEGMGRPWRRDYQSLERDARKK